MNGSTFMGIIEIVVAIATVFTAGATVVAAIYAYRAYNQSIRMRKFTSFDAIFSQLLSTLQCFINNDYLNHTSLKGDKEYIILNDNKLNIDKGQNSFLNFCNVYKRQNSSNQVLDFSEIKRIWITYSNSLCCESNFLNCFKYIYHMIDVVLKSPLDEQKKKDYIGVIQAQLNLDVLFCYLINQIVANKGNDNSFTRVLKQYDFFRNLYKDKANYGKIARLTIPYAINNHYTDRTCRLYHIMIDRFYPTNAEFKERKFNGGNIKGVIEKLDYIQELGMNGIMLTPFYQTNEYHGYHITDYDKVDPHFGTWNDVDLLVQEVHKRNMIIIADFVPNHCHISNSLYSDRKHKDWFLFDRKEKVKGFAGLNFLPMFNTDNAEVQQFFIKRGLKLCEVGFDAIRLDHATGPTYKFWRTFNAALKKQYPNVQIIGEVWGKLDFKPRNPFRYFWNKLRYSAQEARQMEYIGILDGVFDFRYQELICNAVKSNRGIDSNTKLKRSIVKHFANYPSDFQLWLFLDNHDLNRFLFECNGNKKLLQEAINYTKQWHKPFLIYYGTEKGMTNETDIHQMPYGDEQVRKPMIWD